MSAHSYKMAVGAAVFLAAFYIARRGFIGQDAQQYATDLSTRAVIDGVSF